MNRYKSLSETNRAIPNIANLRFQPLSGQNEAWSFWGGGRSLERALKLLDRGRNCWGGGLKDERQQSRRQQNKNNTRR